MTHVCIGDGYLVGPADPVPVQAEIYYFGNLGPTVVGCNQLRCRRCQAIVRQQTKLIANDWELDVAALYAAEDWLSVAGVERGQARLYCCTCTVVANDHPQRLRVDEDDAFDAPFESAPPPWCCAGHPALALPATLDGVIVPEADWSALVRGVLDGTLRPSSRPPFDEPRHWLLQLYSLLDHATRSLMLGAISGAGDSRLLELISSYFPKR